jgi:hypothetical protein
MAGSAIVVAALAGGATANRLAQIMAVETHPDPTIIDIRRPLVAALAGSLSRYRSDPKDGIRDTNASHHACRPVSVITVRGRISAAPDVVKVHVSRSSKSARDIGADRAPG